MTNIEKVKHIREITMAPMNKINKALEESAGDVTKAIEVLVKQRETSAEDMANRKADNSIVYSYVHNNKIGAMIVLASQTDFVAKNELFVQLAKDICMHIVSSPVVATYINQDSIPEEEINSWRIEWLKDIKNKPPQIIDRIIGGKVDKKMEELSLIDQKFVKDDTITIQELINKVAGTVGEKIEIKKFVRLSA